MLEPESRRTISGIVALLCLATVLLLVHRYGSGGSSRGLDLVYFGLFTVVLLGGFFYFSGQPSNLRPQPRQLLLGLSARFGASCSLNLLYWVVVIEPHFYSLSAPPGLLLAVALIDLPVAYAGMVLPFGLRHEAVDIFFQSWSYGYTRFCFGVPPGRLWSHLAVAVPVWLALLYLPAGARLLRNGLRRIRPHASAA